MTNDNSGQLNVELTEQDMKHLLKHGTSNVGKEVGPLNVRVKFSGKVFLDVVLEDSTGKESEAIARAEVDE